MFIYMCIYLTTLNYFLIVKIYVIYYKFQIIYFLKVNTQGFPQ